MYENGKMRPSVTIPGIGGGEIKENHGRVNSTMIDCQNFCKCHNVPPIITLKKKKKRLAWPVSGELPSPALTQCSQHTVVVVAGASEERPHPWQPCCTAQHICLPAQVPLCGALS
jgi:hypothetical protein